MSSSDKNEMNFKEQQLGKGDEIDARSDGGAPTSRLSGSEANNQSRESSSNEPPKTLSPYTLFFRDTANVIKLQNPNYTFEDLKRIVSSMWIALDAVEKNFYNEKAITAGIEYIDQGVNDDVKNTRKDTVPDTSIKNEVPENALQEKCAAPIPQNSTNVSAVVAPKNSQPNNNVQETPVKTETANIELCVRDGCNKPAVLHPDWDGEYCSQDCVVIDCRNAFSDWLLQNKLESEQQLMQ